MAHQCRARGGIFRMVKAHIKRVDAAPHSRRDTTDPGSRDHPALNTDHEYENSPVAEMLDVHVPVVAAVNGPAVGTAASADPYRAFARPTTMIGTVRHRWKIRVGCGLLSEPASAEWVGRPPPSPGISSRRTHKCLHRRALRTDRRGKPHRHSHHRCRRASDRTVHVGPHRQAVRGRRPLPAGPGRR